MGGPHTDPRGVCETALGGQCQRARPTKLRTNRRGVAGCGRVTGSYGRGFSKLAPRWEPYEATTRQRV
jgi:hypothetical protein